MAQPLYDLGGKFSNTSFCAPGVSKHDPAASPSHGNLLEMHPVRSHPRPTRSQTLRGERSRRIWCKLKCDNCRSKLTRFLSLTLLLSSSTGLKVRSHAEWSHSLSPGWLARVGSTAVKLVNVDSRVLNKTFFCGGMQNERKNCGETDLDSWDDRARNLNCCWNL